MAEGISFTTAVRPDVANGGHATSYVPPSRPAKPAAADTHAPTPAAPPAPGAPPAVPPTLAQVVAQVQNSGPGPEGQLLRFLRSLNPPIPPPITPAKSVRA